MPTGFKLAVPQIDLSQPAKRLSSLLADDVSHELPSRTTIGVATAVVVYIMFKQCTLQADFPTAGVVLANGFPITSTQPIILGTSDVDQPTRPNADDYWLAAATGGSSGDVRVIG